LGRFAQADTIIPSPGNSQAWDRFAYANNNPVKYTDPSGHACTRSQNSSGPIIDDDCEQKPPRKLPLIPLFDHLPVDPSQIDGVQWFGGTWNAYMLRSGSNGIYYYCHDFHCGLDILAAWDTPVTAGIQGTVTYAGCSNGNNEGPCKVTIEVETANGIYAITYGHLSGTPMVNQGEEVLPDTIIGGVGNNSRPLDPIAAFTHIHLEIRGPGGWSGGPSVNPLTFMNEADKATLVDIASRQTIEPEMRVFFDGKNTHSYPPPGWLMPDWIQRSLDGPSFFK